MLSMREYPGALAGAARRPRLRARDRSLPEPAPAQRHRRLDRAGRWLRVRLARLRSPISSSPPTTTGPATWWPTSTSPASPTRSGSPRRSCAASTTAGCSRGAAPALRSGACGVLRPACMNVCSYSSPMRQARRLGDAWVTSANIAGLALGGGVAAALLAVLTGDRPQATGAWRATMRSKSTPAGSVPKARPAVALQAGGAEGVGDGLVAEADQQRALQGERHPLDHAARALLERLESESSSRSSATNASSRGSAPAASPISAKKASRESRAARHRPQHVERLDVARALPDRGQRALAEQAGHPRLLHVAVAPEALQRLDRVARGPLADPVLEDRRRRA